MRCLVRPGLTGFISTCACRFGGCGVRFTCCEVSLSGGASGFVFGSLSNWRLTRASGKTVAFVSNRRGSTCCTTRSTSCESCECTCSNFSTVISCAPPRSFRLARYGRSGAHGFGVPRGSSGGSPTRSGGRTSANTPSSGASSGCTAGTRVSTAASRSATTGDASDEKRLAP